MSAEQKVVRRRCPWTHCSWDFFVILGSDPSKAIGEIALDGHVRDVHHGKVPAANSDVFRSFFDLRDGR